MICEVSCADRCDIIGDGFSDRSLWLPAMYRDKTGIPLTENFR
ncbi:hypothetical protein CLOSTASPAR_04375 [[Clostridium] asparagiforme DSM 15981]|uniref:Uncharacterized protein n=1 Tax=[Clostridium] asparagiforme DSM 15981 TaxID=518636 RepID=C0D529_9FIRM|nr:hypothetical protein CLOSTASPAR_04375 [[Clostridium] asparagiforme DSM 15981]